MGWLWHCRIAHIGLSQLKKAFKRGMVVGVKDVTFDKNKLCSACQAGKQFATSHPMKAYLSTSRCYDVEIDETNRSQGEVFSCDDVGDEPLREVMKNIVLGKSIQKRM